MIGVTVVICTHNPRPHYLRRVLSALRDQTLPVAQWELLVVDNASQEPLTAATWDLSWHPRARIVREEELGIAAARMRGMRETAADLLVFVDDDNVIETNYLEQVLKIDREWPQLGVWGGSIVPEFEVEPAEHLRNMLRSLALREVKAPSWGNVSNHGDTDPWGAGLCARARVAAKYCLQFKNSPIRIGGRVGRELLSGEDTEICYVACSMGLGTGLFPTLKLVHLIPKERVDEDYLIRIFTTANASLHLLDYKWHGLVPPSPYSFGNAVRLFKQFLLEGRFQRRIFVARLRAIAAARRAIAASGNQSRTALMNPKGIMP